MVASNNMPIPVIIYTGIALRFSAAQHLIILLFFLILTARGLTPLSSNDRTASFEFSA